MDSLATHQEGIEFHDIKTKLKTTFLSGEMFTNSDFIFRILLPEFLYAALKNPFVTSKVFSWSTHSRIDDLGDMLNWTAEEFCFVF